MSEQVKINYFDLGLHTANELCDMCTFLGKNYFNWNIYGFEACDLYYDFCKERVAYAGTNVKIIHGAISNTEEYIRLYYAKNALGHSIFESKNKKLDQLSKGSDNEGVGMPLMFNYCFQDANFKKPVYNLSLKKLYSWIKKWTRTLGITPTISTRDNKFVEVDETNILSWFSEGKMDSVKHEEIPRLQYEYSKGIIFSKWVKENIPDFENSFNILRVNIEGAEYQLFEDLIESDLVKHINIFCGTGNDVEKISEYSADKYYKMLEDNDIKLYRFTDWRPELNDPIEEIITKKVEEWKIKNALS
jgi:hypothetical protein